MIINPIIIYLIGIVDGIKDLMFFLTVAIIILMLVTGIIACAYSDENNFKGLEKCKKTFIKLSVFLVLTIALNTFIPNKNTMIAMVSTKYITTENIKLGKDVVVDTIKEIVEVINKEEK